MLKAYEATIMEGAKQKYAFSVEKISQISDRSKKIIKIILAMACVLLLIVAMTMLLRGLKHRHSDKSDKGDEVATECSRWINNPNIAPSPQSSDDCSFDDIPNCTCDDSEVPSSQCCEEAEKHKICMCFYMDFRNGFNGLLNKIGACSNIKGYILCPAK